MPFPTQRCLQTPDLPFGAFDHLFPRIRSAGQSESHPDSRMQFTPILGAVIPSVFDSMRYGNGINTPPKYSIALYTKSVGLDNMPTSRAEEVLSNITRALEYLGYPVIRF